MDSKCRKAFTLAEVLITLAVIGVVAALTIPTLMKSWQDKALYTKWRKEFSVATQAVKMLEIEKNRCESFGCSNGGDMKNDFNSVMKFIKLDQWKNISGSSYKAYKDTSTSVDWSGWCWDSALASDGSAWCFDPINADCSDVWDGLPACGRIYVDVNGAKSPNMYGKDMFCLYIARKSGGYVVRPCGGACTVGGTNMCSTLALTTAPANMP